MTKTDTLIIGAGVSGLGCAHVLEKAGREYIVVSKNLGGRIHAESAGSDVPYGTAYCCEDYFHMRPFTDMGSSSKRNLRHYFFYNGREYVHLLRFGTLKHLPKILKFKKILKKFRKHIIDYRAAMDKMSLKDYFEQDEFLLYTWKTPAKDFIAEHGFEEIDQFIINPIVATTTYGESDEINTAYYLGMALPMVVPTWRADFRHTVERMTQGIEDKIVIGEVTKVEKQDNGSFMVETSEGNYAAQNIVFAAPHKHIGHLYPSIPAPHRQEDIHVMNVQGVRKPPFDGKPVVFLRSREHNGIYALYEMKPGTNLVYSKQENPDLSQYFSEYEIVKDVYWNPVMNIPDDTLIDNKIEDHVYLAGDYNISGLEDAYVSGVSVGNRVLRETS